MTTATISVELDMGALQGLATTLGTDMDRALGVLAMRVFTECQARMADPKSGRVYRIRAGRGWRLHQASAPGEAPAKMYGFLSGTGFVRHDGFLQWSVGITADYAAYLEFGTVRMAPRPYLLPALVNIVGDYATYIEGGGLFEASNQVMGWA